MIQARSAPATSLPAGHVVTTAVVPAAVVVSLEGMQSSQVARHPTMTSAGSHGGAMFAQMGPSQIYPKPRTGFRCFWGSFYRKAIVFDGKKLWNPAIPTPETNPMEMDVSQDICQ